MLTQAMLANDALSSDDAKYDVDEFHMRSIYVSSAAVMTEKRPQGE